MRSIAVFTLMVVLFGVASNAEAKLYFPDYQGSEWVDLARIGLEHLPNLNPPAPPGPITGSASLDSLIWEIAFARGYEMRQTHAGGLVIQDGQLMQPLTASAWEAMQAALAAAGHPIRIHSAYRSVSAQKGIFNSKLMGSSSVADINAVLDYSSPPGASRHHSGYALDIKTVDGTIGTFKTSAAYAWLAADNFYNAKRFGFIPSYPDGAPNQGPKPEPWEFLYVGVETIRGADQQFFYRSADGTFKYYGMKDDGSLGVLLKSGTYSLGWDSISAVDVDGDGRDEQFFYRSADGTFKYYGMKDDGSLGVLLKSGTYSLGWDSISAVDVDGDGRDEQFFYRSADGTFKYYGMKDDGSLGVLLKSGTYSLGWDSISAVDVDGDGRDEQFFYRSADGTFKYYGMKDDGSLGVLLKSGTYSLGWDSISAVDVDGDGRDEQFFYRSADGTFKYYGMKDDGSLGVLLKSGTYSLGWDSISAIYLGK